MKHSHRSTLMQVGWSAGVNIIGIRAPVALSAFL